MPLLRGENVFEGLEEVERRLKEKGYIFYAGLIRQTILDGKIALEAAKKCDIDTTVEKLVDFGRHSAKSEVFLRELKELEREDAELYGIAFYELAKAEDRLEKEVRSRILTC